MALAEQFSQSHQTKREKPKMEVVPRRINANEDPQLQKYFEQVFQKLTGETTRNIEEYIDSVEKGSRGKKGLARFISALPLMVRRQIDDDGMMDLMKNPKNKGQRDEILGYLKLHKNDLVDSLRKRAADKRTALNSRLMEEAKNMLKGETEVKETGHKVESKKEVGRQAESEKFRADLLAAREVVVRMKEEAERKAAARKAIEGEEDELIHQVGKSADEVARKRSARKGIQELIDQEDKDAKKRESVAELSAIMTKLKQRIASLETRDKKRRVEIEKKISKAKSFSGLYKIIAKEFKPSKKTVIENGKKVEMTEIDVAGEKYDLGMIKQTLLDSFANKKNEFSPTSPLITIILPPAFGIQEKVVELLRDQQFKGISRTEMEDIRYRTEGMGESFDKAYEKRGELATDKTKFDVEMAGIDDAVEGDLAVQRQEMQRREQKKRDMPKLDDRAMASRKDVVAMIEQNPGMSWEEAGVEASKRWRGAKKSEATAGGKLTRAERKAFRAEEKAAKKRENQKRVEERKLKKLGETKMSDVENDIYDMMRAEDISEQDAIARVAELKGIEPKKLKAMMKGKDFDSMARRGGETAVKEKSREQMHIDAMQTLVNFEQALPQIYQATTEKQKQALEVGDYEKFMKSVVKEYGWFSKERKQAKSDLKKLQKMIREENSIRPEGFDYDGAMAEMLPDVGSAPDTEVPMSVSEAVGEPEQFAKWEAGLKNKSEEQLAEMIEKEFGIDIYVAGEEDPEIQALRSKSKAFVALEDAFDASLEEADVEDDRENKEQAA